MRLMDVLRSLIGERDEPLSPLDGFRSSADSNGVNFYLPLPSFKALQTGQGNALEKIQLIVLNMLAEQGIAEPTANGFHIGAEDVAGMDLEQADILRLPRRFPGRFVTSISGRTGNSGFRVGINVEMPDGAAAFSRKGPYLCLTSTESYWLTPAELMGLMAWERHESLAGEQRGEAANLRLMAELQTAARSGMRIDLSHFERLDVVVPDNVGVFATRLPDGSLQLCPSLGDGATPDQLEKRWAQLDMSADGGVLRIDNRVVLLDQARMDGIRNVLANKRIPADQVAEFIAMPTAFLDAALVNLEVGFSARVAGVGKLQHMDFGALDATKNDWFALDKRPSPPEALAKLIQSPEELQRFEEVLQAAREQGASTLSFAGEAIDISDAPVVEQQLERVRQTLQKRSAAEVEERSGASTEGPKEKVGVILKDADEINSELLQRANRASLSKEPDWAAYARQPFPHQRDGIEWMLKLLGSALQDDHDDLYRLQGSLLADDMGLGKTYMSLVAVGEYLASQRAADKPQKPVLVVAPLSLLENWEDEVGKTFTSIPFRDVVVLQSGRSLNEFRIKGAERESVQLASMIDDSGMMDEQSIRYALAVGPEAGVHRLDMDRRLVLTTYQTLRDYQFSLCRIDWGMVIFDEAQNIKNPNALQTRAAKGLKADFKLLATGTPVENSLGDFWCLMDSAQPGLLGSWETYRDTWIKPILAASDEERDSVRAQLGEKLRKAVGVFMLRRVKEDQLKGLPSKSILSGVAQVSRGIQHYAPELGAVMKGVQLQTYDEVLDGYRSRRASAEDMRGTALAALTQLRSISLHPRLDDETSLYSRDAQHARQLMMESGKLAVMLKLLDEILSKGEKVILFMMTKRLQRLLKLWLDQIYGLDVAIINGDTKAVATREEDMTRKRLIAAFEQKDGFNLLIMSPVAAGVGLTVVGANHVVHLERHWNPAKEAQASDRVYRIGQQKDVFIHLPAVTHPQFDSFDVHLDRLLRGKLMLKDAVVTPEAVSEGEMIQSMGL
ncbi:MULTISPECIES: DEAD/DEAH box helicase [unclassified Pseudomonas]|uniref:DEAD/DEAH box helicase n=1 Tax=unclassified Pseudomonas TaxID=196821 RepID=UPI0008CB033C|nr:MULTISPECIES: DEAD/DEAH box helicase [unclassified Pseudomonas]MCD4867148.1 DEAD/DEAH box helicase [Pseudomonas sp. PLB05]SEP47258.1 Superfamily II DNA or RNA helicase, SNF2 family [Pseudomonas sp. Snoq117.2]